MDKNALRENISEFIMNQLVPENTEVKGSTPLISSSLIDSMGLVTLTLHIEKTLEKKIPATDVRKENWDSLDLIMNYLETKGFIQ